MLVLAFKEACMARPLRIEYEGAIYHVTSRENDRKKVFLSPTDYKKFLSYLSEGP
jgi:REP element-mobilizing transposase RayT